MNFIYVKVQVLLFLQLLCIFKKKKLRFKNNIGDILRQCDLLP